MTTEGERQWCPHNPAVDVVMHGNTFGKDPIAAWKNGERVFVCTTHLAQTRNNFPSSLVFGEQGKSERLYLQIEIDRKENAINRQTEGKHRAPPRDKEVPTGLQVDRCMRLVCSCFSHIIYHLLPGWNKHQSDLQHAGMNFHTWIWSSVRAEESWQRQW